MNNLTKSVAAIALLTGAIATPALAYGTALTERARGVEPGDTRATTIETLGTASFVIHVDDGTPDGEGLRRITAGYGAYKLIWVNGECSPVEIVFDENNEAMLLSYGSIMCTNGEWDELPDDEFACETSEYGNLCN